MFELEATARLLVVQALQLTGSASGDAAAVGELRYVITLCREKQLSPLLLAQQQTALARLVENMHGKEEEGEEGEKGSCEGKSGGEGNDKGQSSETSGEVAMEPFWRRPVRRCLPGGNREA